MEKAITSNHFCFHYNSLLNHIDSGTMFMLSVSVFIYVSRTCCVSSSCVRREFSLICSVAKENVLIWNRLQSEYRNITIYLSVRRVCVRARVDISTIFLFIHFISAWILFQVKLAIDTFGVEGQMQANVQLMCLKWHTHLCGPMEGNVQRLPTLSRVECAAAFFHSF